MTFDRSERARHGVLVPDAHFLASVACMRDLASSGYRVTVASRNPNTLAFGTRLAVRRVLCPDYRDAAAYYE